MLPRLGLCLARARVTLRQGSLANHGGWPAPHLPDRPIPGARLTWSRLPPLRNFSRTACCTDAPANTEGPDATPPAEGQGEASATTAAAKLDFTAAQENLLEGLVHEYAHPIPIHPFDSFQVVRRLEDGGFTRPQAVLLMDVIRSMTIRATAPVHEDMLKKADLDNSMYLFKAALTELRTEIRVLRQIDRAALQSEIDTVEQDIDNLRHRLSEDMINLRSEIQIELNQYKSDQRERVQTMAEAIQELNDTFTRSLGAVRTEMEAVKWETTRKGIIAIYGAVGLLLLLAMMMPSRKPKVEPKGPTEDPYSFESSPAAASEQINGFLNMSSGSGGSGRRPAAR